MSKTDPYWSAMIAAEKVVKERAISALPVDPIALAQDLGIEVVAKPASAQGVSGMLLRRGNAFGIAYATHIDSTGFQNFSVAHELGHYFLRGHVDAVSPTVTFMNPTLALPRATATRWRPTISQLPC